MKIYNKEQRNLFMKTFGVDPHIFSESSMLMAITGRWLFDILKFDKWCNDNDSDFDSEKCIYKGQKDTSLSEYLTIKYGEHITDLVSDIMNGNFTQTDYIKPVEMKRTK